MEQTSIRDVEVAVLRDLELGRLDTALHTLHDVVKRMVTEPLCTALVLGSPTLDRLCQAVGARTWAMLAAQGHSTRDTAQSVYCYVVTRLQNSGGHRQVILDLIAARPEARHVILSTEIAGRSDFQHLGASLAAIKNVEFEAAPNVSFQGRLEWLQSRVVAVSAAQTCLFNHHQDSVAIAALQPDMGLKVAFCHHGDHHLCLGVFLSHVTHVDLHPMGHRLCRDQLGLQNVYWPLIAKDSGQRAPATRWMMSGGLVTCTAARANKVEIPYFVSYVEVIPRLLQVTGGRHVHIGRLSPWALWRLRRNMKRRGLSAQQLLYLPWVPSVWQALQTHGVDLYVASFPYGGALTLIEAMGAGVPVVLHQHIHSQLLSCLDLAYTGAFSWRDPADLLAYCTGLTAPELERQSRLARARYEQCHTLQALLQSLGDEGGDTRLSATAQAPFHPAYDEWGMWMASQVSAVQVLRRTAFRLFKSLQARWT